MTAPRGFRDNHRTRGAIRAKLPFLIDLTADERRNLAKMGDKSEAFVNKVLEVAEQNPRWFPPPVE